MNFRLIMMACLLSLTAAAQSASPAPASVAKPVPASVSDEELRSLCQLNLARNGKEVVVSWVLPQFEVKQFEIFRNGTNQAQGRGRVAALRQEVGIYYDSVTDTEATYWYWLKITFGNGHVINVGPVATPNSKVWTP